jgi:hypothetical protein
MSDPSFGLEDERAATKALVSALGAISDRGGRPRFDTIIWEALCEAIALVDTLPDQERKWLRGGSGGWGMVGLTRSEAEDIERARQMMGLQPGDALRAGSTAADVDRALSVCKWLAWCRRPEEADDFHKVVYLAALNKEVAATKLWDRSRHGKRSTLRDIRQTAIGLIRKGLEAETRITFTQGGFTVGS